MIFPGAFRIADSLPHSLRLLFRIFVVQFVLGACLASSMAYAAGAELPQATPLRVAVYDVPPYGYVNPDGSLSGISVDLWRRVAERLERQTSGRRLRESLGHASQRMAALAKFLIEAPPRCRL
jgi:ABC-type amino acid transport substrate-binding protein